MRSNGYRFGCSLTVLCCLLASGIGCGANREQKRLCANLQIWLPQALAGQDYLSRELRTHSTPDYQCAFVVQGPTDETLYEFLIVLVYSEMIAEQSSGISIFPQHHYPDFTTGSNTTGSDSALDHFLSRTLMFRYHSRRGIIHHVLLSKEPGRRLGFHPESREFALRVFRMISEWPEQEVPFGRKRP